MHIFVIAFNVFIGFILCVAIIISILFFLRSIEDWL